MRYIDMQPLGDQAIIVKLGEEADEETRRRIIALIADLEQRPFAGLVEAVPGHTTVTIYYDLLQLASTMHEYGDGVSRYTSIKNILHQRIGLIDERVTIPSREIEIPICYGGRFGPDLDRVAQHNGLSTAEVVQIHSAGTYIVYMMGFAPGFPYLSGMDPRIALPRRATPRLKTPAGSVGIAGGQTGIYPLETPGGWNLIGRTPLAMFIPDRHPPSLLQAGDRIRFYPISEAEYRAQQTVYGSEDSSIGCERV